MLTARKFLKNFIHSKLKPLNFPHFLFSTFPDNSNYLFRTFKFMFSLYFLGEREFTALSLVDAICRLKVKRDVTILIAVT